MHNDKHTHISEDLINEGLREAGCNITEADDIQIKDSNNAGYATQSAGLVFSGQVLAISRLNKQSIRVTIRDTGGLIHDLQIPFSQEQSERQLPIGLDQLVKVIIQGV